MAEAQAKHRCEQIGMEYAEVINHIIRSRGYTKYLEIGVQDPRHNFSRIECAFKIGVDPATNGVGVLKMTSDLFFQHNGTLFDLIFIDGDHSYEQSKRDLQNALQALTPQGCLMAHDCNPRTKELATPRQVRVGVPWCGEVYRAFSDFTASIPNVSLCLDLDHGMGIVEAGRISDSRKPEQVNVDWEMFASDRKKWINLISMDEWMRSGLAADR